MDEKIKGIIKQFSEAVQFVMSTMAMVQVRPSAPYVKKDNTATGDISGVIGFSNARNHSGGTMSLTLTEECALGIVESMVGERYSELGQEVADAVGELTNMICGQARKNLSEKMNMDFEGAIPSVVTGKEHSIRHMSSSAILAMPFSSEHGELTVEVCFS
ncbi:MAG: chemotaxis protein CheX [Desulfonatronovibrionaceae bacterium]